MSLSRQSNNAPVDELLPTRRSLLSRLKDWDDQESWKDFFATYWKLIYGTARRAGLDDATAQDVVQETVVRVAKGIAGFKNEGRYGSFKGWLLTITKRRIIDHYRRLRCEIAVSAEDEGDGATPVLDRVPDPASVDWESTWESDWQRNLVDAALERIKARVKARQFQIFDCSVLKGWPLHEVTTKLRVNAGQVYFARFKIRSMLKREVRRLEKEWT
jgi:RNA polymerase sigma factor (sigma-70 family)